MKIIHVVPYIKNLSAGTTHAVISICNSLVEHGCEIILYTLSPIPNRKYKFKIKSFKPSIFPHKALGRCPEMYNALLKDSKDADIIHSHMLWMSPSYYAGLVAKQNNIKYICSPHGSLSKWALSRSVWKKKISMILGQNAALKYVDYFHITAEHERQEVIDAGFGDKFILIKNGIVIPKKLTKKKNSFKTVVFISRIHPKKGVENLIQSWGKLFFKYPNWKLKIIGPYDSISYLRFLEEIIKKEKMKNIEFLGEITGAKKDSILMNSDLFVFPTFSENFGLVVGEALACKIPVICSKGAPWSGLITNNAGWWIDIGVEPLTESLMIAMNTDSKILNKMGENGRSWMKKEFSWDNIGKEFKNSYEHVLGMNKNDNLIIK